MENYIAISALNDFIFCPYSIYLHSVYKETDDDIYKASPQLLGSKAHESSDNRTLSTRKCDLFSFPVYSYELGIMGIVDVYKGDRQLLVERKNNLKNIYRGQLYQLWAQYYCMVEMGYPVSEIAFYEISTNKMYYQPLPTEKDRKELKLFIEEFIAYSPAVTEFAVNPNKCRHCIYCNLCDRTNLDNVYT
jgi:CRISPR-associated protein Cas4